MSEHIEYRRCVEHDITALKHLWSLCFPSDSADDIDSFFEEIYPIAVPFAGFIADEPVSMLYLLPAEIRSQELCARVWYLYAGGTHPSHRSNGYYAELMNVARNWARSSEGVAIYLRPAEPRLFQYYASIGYAEPIHSYIGQKAGTILNGTRITTEEYLQRRASFSPTSAFLWQPIRPIINHFIGDKGYAIDDGCHLQLIVNGDVYEQLVHEQEDIGREVSALWIPTCDDAQIIDRIKQGVSYSLFFGE